jgi:hypothetical protein
MKTLLVAIVLVGTAGLVLAQQKPVPNVSAKAASAKPSISPATNNAVVPDFPIIGYIEKQDRTITIKSGPKGTIYSVKSADGKLLCNNLTLEQLRAQLPELHQFVKTAVAGNISNGATGDSRLRVTDGNTSGRVDGRVR